MQGFHGRGTVEQEATEGAEVVFSVLFLRSGSGFIFYVAAMAERFGFDCQNRVPLRPKRA
jgi:hypothetical protein